MSAAWASNKLGSPEGWPLPVFRLVDDSRATWASCVPGSSEEWPLLAFRLVVVSMHSGCVCVHRGCHRCFVLGGEERPQEHVVL